MIQICTLPVYADYDRSKKPSENPQSGGMSIKWSRVLDILKRNFPGSVLHTDHENVVEGKPLLLCADYVRNLYETGGFEQFVEWLSDRESDTVFVVTTKTPLRMTKTSVNMVAKHCSTVATSCRYVKNLLRYFGIRSSLLVDPITDSYMEHGINTERRNRVIACGQIAWFKNTRATIDIFKDVKKETGLQTCYIGGAGFWNLNWGTESLVNEALEMQDELEELCDVYVREASEPEFAKALYSSRFGLWCTWHDDSAYSLFEMMYAGVVPVCAPHGLTEELNAVRVCHSREQMVKKFVDLEHMDQWETESAGLSRDTHKRCGEGAFLNQLRPMLS